MIFKAAFLLLISACASAPTDLNKFKSFEVRKIRETVEKANPKIAIFDIANTLFYGDIGDLALYWMAKYQWFDANIFNDLNVIEHISPTRLSRLQQTYSRLKRTIPTPQLSQSFVELLFDTYRELCQVYSENYCYRWTVQLFSGLSEDRIRQIARSVIVKEESPEESTHRISSNFIIQGGLFPNEMILQLFQYLQKEKFNIYLISAAHQILIEELIKKYFPNFPLERVFGATQEFHNGRATSHVPRLPLALEKSSLVEEQISPNPALVVCDSIHDWETLLLAKHLKIIIKRDPRLLKLTEQYFEKNKNDDWLFLRPSD